MTFLINVLKVIAVIMFLIVQYNIEVILYNQRKLYNNQLKIESRIISIENILNNEIELNKMRWLKW